MQRLIRPSRRHHKERGVRSCYSTLRTEDVQTQDLTPHLWADTLVPTSTRAGRTTSRLILAARGPAALAGSRKGASPVRSVISSLAPSFRAGPPALTGQICVDDDVQRGAGGPGSRRGPFGRRNGGIVDHEDASVRCQVEAPCRCREPEVGRERRFATPRHGFGLRECPPQSARSGGRQTPCAQAV